MKIKTLMLMLGILLCGTVQAEWVEIGVNDDVGTTFYVDPTSIRKSGNIVKVWSLSDYNKSQGQIPYMSIMLQREYDCIEERARQLHMTHYAKNMGEGDPVFIHTEPRNWLQVAPGTVGETIWEFACKKK